MGPHTVGRRWCGFADPEHHKLLTDTKKKDTTFVVSFFLVRPKGLEPPTFRTGI